jgi:GST-like protein
VSPGSAGHSDDIQDIKTVTYALYTRKGWGSAISEAALTLAGVEFELREPRGHKARGIPSLKAVNPLGQFPTLVCPDGTVLTESAAIMFHIDDTAPEAGFVPPAGAPERRAFLRWLQFIVGAIYPTFTYADYPARYVTATDARKELVESIKKRRKSMWLQMEDAIEPNPWFLGQQFSALDIYTAVMTRWGPGRRWFARHCPALTSVALQADNIETLAPVWTRNFQ